MLAARNLSSPRQHALGDRAEPADEERQRHRRDVGRGPRRVENGVSRPPNSATSPSAITPMTAYATVACHVTSAASGPRP